MNRTAAILIMEHQFVKKPSEVFPLRKAFPLFHHFTIPLFYHQFYLLLFAAFLNRHFVGAAIKV